MKRPALIPPWAAALCAFLVCAGLPGAVAAESIFVVQGAGGHSVLYTNRQPAKGRVVGNLDMHARLSRTWWSFSRRCGIKVNYERLIAREARRHNVDPALVKAVVHAESAFNACARSPKGAMGLMQLMPYTARELGVSNAYEPAENLRGGVDYLAQLLDRYDGDVPLSLAAYNAGPGAVQQHGGVPPYQETRAYVRRVMNLREHYRRG